MDLLEVRLLLRHHSNGVHAVTECLGRGGELGDDSKPEVVHAAGEEEFRLVLFPILWPEKRDVPAEEGVTEERMVEGERTWEGTEEEEERRRRGGTGEEGG